MSNFTNNNLIAVNPADVPAGSLSAKIGDVYFVAANAVPQGTGFYKCASVDTTNHTWTGYRAVLTNGVYIFEGTATTGLTYGVAYMPSVGGIYNDGATISVNKMFNGITENGLIFYASLDGSHPTEAGTGQTLHSTGTVTYSTIQGIPCGVFDGYSDLHENAFNQMLPIGYSDRTVSGWMYATSSGGWRWIVGYGTQGIHGHGDILGVTEDGYPVYAQHPDVIYSSSVINSWVHVCGVVQNNIRKLYVNGVLRGEEEMTQDTQDTYGVHIGSSCGSEFFSGYAAAIRIYNRALTSSEITALAGEFTPTVA